MRLRVKSPCVSTRTLRVSSNAFGAGLGEIVLQVSLDAAHAAVAHSHPSPGHLLHQIPEVLPGFDHVEKDRERPQLHSRRTHAGEVVPDPGDLRENDPNVVAALRDLDPEELLHRHAVAHVVDQRRDVVEPVGVGDDAVVVDHFRHLLEAAVEVADLHFGLFDLLAVEPGHETDDAVHGRMCRTDVEHHFPRLETRGLLGSRGGCVRRHV